MRLVDDQRIVALQLPISLQLFEQNSISHQFHTAVGTQAIVEADLISNGASDTGAQFRGDSRGDGASGDAPRLSMADESECAAAGLDAKLRQLRGLSRSGGSAKDDDL